MNGDWCFFPSKFSASECNNILITALKLTIHGETKYNSRDILTDDKDYKDLSNDIFQLALDANNHFFQFHLTKMDNYKIITINNSSENIDFNIPFWINKNPLNKKLCFILELSDPDHYDGGFITFNNFISNEVLPNQRDLRKQGSIAFVPAFCQWSVSPIITGVKHFLFGSISGPTWQ